MAKGLNMATPAIALLATLAVAGFTHREELGRMLGDLADKRDGDTARGDGGPTGNAFGTGFGGKSGLGDILGNLGGMLGSGDGGNILKDGLDGLLDRFKSTGHSDEADSWVKDGPNRTIDAAGLEEALGADVVAQLQTQTGLSREELLERLSTNLPNAVDSLTPDGRTPTHEEASRYVSAPRS